MLNVPYSEQLEQKSIELASVFSNFIEKGKLEASAILPIVGSDEPYHYRDKVTTPFVSPRKAVTSKNKGARKTAKGAPLSNRRAKGFKTTGRARVEVVSGIYARNSHQVVPVDDCLLENPTASKIVKAIRSIMERHGIEPYDEDTGRGFMRNAMVRVGHQTGEVLVTIITNGDEFPHAKSFCRELVSKVPECTSIVQNVNTRQTNVILGEKFRTLYGPGFILDRLCGLTFRISPGAFYQVNSTQTERLYERAIELAAIEKDDSLIDAYCGTGTIGLVARAKWGNPLLGLDSSRQAISDARTNAMHNGANNAVFVAEDATDFMREMASGLKSDRFPPGFDMSRIVAILDPPRSGATEEFLEALISLGPKKIVYISCNPETQARDCGILCESGYEISVLQPIDMFPHTPHIESIALLEKPDSRERNVR